MNSIGLQDIDLSLRDVKHIKVIVIYVFLPAVHVGPYCTPAQARSPGSRPTTSAAIGMNRTRGKHTC